MSNGLFERNDSYHAGYKDGIAELRRQIKNEAQVHIDNIVDELLDMETIFRGHSDDGN